MPFAQWKVMWSLVKIKMVAFNIAGLEDKRFRYFLLTETHDEEAGTSQASGFVRFQV